MTVRSSVEASLRAAQPSDGQDAATAELARTYARLIDGAAPNAALAKAIRLVASCIETDDEQVVEAWRRITVALARHSVASDLGPKLLAALDALLLTPRARTAAKKAVTDAKPATNPLDQLAAARARKAGAESLDSTAP
jgi:hypothetical protein